MLQKASFCLVLQLSERPSSKTQRKDVLVHQITDIVVHDREVPMCKN